MHCVFGCFLHPAPIFLGDVIGKPFNVLPCHHYLEVASFIEASGIHGILDGLLLVVWKPRVLDLLHHLQNGLAGPI